MIDPAPASPGVPGEFKVPTSGWYHFGDGVPRLLTDAEATGFEVPEGVIAVTFDSASPGVPGEAAQAVCAQQCDPVVVTATHRHVCGLAADHPLPHQCECCGAKWEPPGVPGVPPEAREAFLAAFHAALDAGRDSPNAAEAALAAAAPVIAAAQREHDAALLEREADKAGADDFDSISVPIGAAAYRDAAELLRGEAPGGE